MIRPESSPAQVDSGAKIIRVKESGGQVYRMKWNGGAYVITTEQLQVYEDSGTLATLDAGAESLAVWRPAPQRWETIAGVPGEDGPAGPPGDSTLFADFTATADSLRTADTITADIDQYWGGTPADLTAVTVNKLSDHDLTVFSGDKFRGVWDGEDEEWKLFWFDGLRLTVKGTIAGTAVTASTPTFTLTTPSLANGWRLPASITVTNNPPIYADIGATVYARFNLTVGTTPATNWDTGDGGNFLHMLKGIGSYDEGGTKQTIVNEEGGDDPKWQTVPDIIRFARVTTAITAATGPGNGAWGAGQVKLQDPDTGVVAATAINATNMLIDVGFALDSQVQVDTSYTPVRVLNGTCAAVDWS
jgi:hypothetical protein